MTGRSAIAAAGTLRALRLAVLSGAALLFVAPIVWLALAPSKTSDALFKSSPLSFGAFHGYARAWSHLLTFSDHNALIVRWLVNSLAYSTATALIVLAACLPAGYALAVYRFPGRHVILVATLFAMLLPPSALILPLFLELNAVHLIGSPLAVILPLSFYPFGAFLAYIFFSTTVPPSLLSAGRIDGCSEIRLFWSVALPLARSVAPVIALFSFLSSWNEFFLPYLTLSDEKLYPLQVGLADLSSATGAFLPSASASNLWPIGRPEMALAGLIAIIPIVVVFLASQRILKAGVLSGLGRG